MRRKIEYMQILHITWICAQALNGENLILRQLPVLRIAIIQNSFLATNEQEGDRKCYSYLTYERMVT
jgi:hypothetical protein